LAQSGLGSAVRAYQWIAVPTPPGEAKTNVFYPISRMAFDQALGNCVPDPER